MRLRRGEAKDAEAIAGLLGTSYERMTYIPNLHTAEEHLWYTRTILMPGNEVWVAEDGGRVVGFAVLTADTLLQIHVAPEAQNRGVGAALVARAKERRPDGLSLWTFQKNEGARRFYERHGFEVAQLTDGQANEEREPDVQYAWRPK